MLLCKVLFVFIFSSSVRSEEPRCSKYDFEEKVLEKMVRIEFQMERMKSEIDQSAKRMEAKKTENDGLMTRQEALKNNLNSTIADALDEHIKHVQASRETVVTPSTSFKAMLSGSVSNVIIGRAIVFPDVLFNEGDAYSSGTGKFTANTNGTYMFSFSFCLRYQKTLVAGIMVDGKSYTVSLLYGDGNHECISGDAVAVLTAGQKVWVEALSGSITGDILDQRSANRWNAFSGLFIHG